MSALKPVLQFVSLAAFLVAAAGLPTGRVGALGVGLFCWEASALL